MRTSSKRAPALVLSSVVGIVFFAGSQPVLADQHTAGVPALNSRPSAPFTVYLDVNGFNYNGVWSGGELALPGSTPSVGDAAANATFDFAQVAAIKDIWARMAQSYVGMNVNVTTVDPSVSALGSNATDAARQAFYDATPNLMHTVVGSQVRGGAAVTPSNPQGKWYSTAADGVSGLGVIDGTSNTAGAGGHTNWMFTEDQQGTNIVNGVAVPYINGGYIGAVAAHENGHAFGLSHQSDYTGNTLVNEYSLGDTVGDAATPATYVPIIGQADGKQRITWRVGDTDTNGTRTPVNDLTQMLTTNTVATASAAGRTGATTLHFVSDGVGHDTTTATLLALSGTSINASLDQGVIVPVSESSPNPIGVNNYTKDFFKFTLTTASKFSLTATDGTSFLQAGVADGNGTLRSTLTILNALGSPIGTATEDANTLFETYAAQLAAGTYYAQIASFGGHNQLAPDFNAAQYYDMGAYFLTGSIVGVPEPTMVCVFAIGVVGVLRRRHSAN